VAACGIFVADILDAVPIDKYFELFKPGAGGEGGFIRIGMTFDHDQVSTQPPPQQIPASAKQPAENGGPSAKTMTENSGASFQPKLSFSNYSADDTQQRQIDQVVNQTRAAAEESRTAATRSHPDTIAETEVKVSHKEQSKKKTEKKGGGGGKAAVAVLVLGAAAGLAAFVIKQKQEEKQKKK
jgi:hypothetical protein